MKKILLSFIAIILFSCDKAESPSPEQSKMGRVEIEIYKNGERLYGGNKFLIENFNDIKYHWEEYKKDKNLGFIQLNNALQAYTLSKDFYVESGVYYAFALIGTYNDVQYSPVQVRVDETTIVRFDFY